MFKFLSLTASRQWSVNRQFNLFQPCSNFASEGERAGKNCLETIWQNSHLLQAARQAQEYLCHQAVTVMLCRQTEKQKSNLLSRQAFIQELTASIEKAKIRKTRHVLCYLDLDQFSAFNEIYGHAAGEQLLAEVASFLQQAVSSSDTLATLGGDEFGLLFHHRSLPEAESLTDSLRQQLAKFRFCWQGRQFTVSASIGLVPIDAESQDWSSALGTAEAACQSAKARGRNRTYVYRRGDRELARRHSDRQGCLQLTQALEENRFVLYCQRIAPVSQDGREHYEVLLRLLDERNAIVLPTAFMPAAERYNLMPAIDRWVIATFFAHYEAYYQQQLRQKSLVSPPLYTLNLSGASINNDQFLTFLEEQFNSHRIPPQSICFEITETIAIANLDQAAYFVCRLKRLGCHFALDDFGKGMSSFSYLKNLPVDYLKIDGSFVRNMARDRIDYIMVECFNQIGHAMNIRTIAEFVEDIAILNLLQRIGVDYAQGYGIARPCPLAFS